MSDPSDRPASPSRWRLGLRTVILLIAVVAVWLTVIINNRENDRMTSRIAAMRSMAHELILEDPGKIAVVKLEEMRMDDERWEIHLPPGRYRLCMATRKVAEKGFPPPMESAPIAAGMHRLALVNRDDGEAWRARAILDGADLLTIEEAKGWGGQGSVGGGDFSLSEQRTPDKPLILYQRRYMRSTKVPDGPTDGLMLWIEPDPGPGPTER